MKCRSKINDKDKKKKKKVVPGRKLLAIVNQDKEEKKANLSACN